MLFLKWKLTYLSIYQITVKSLYPVNAAWTMTWQLWVWKWKVCIFRQESRCDSYFWRWVSHLSLATWGVSAHWARWHAPCSAGQPFPVLGCASSSSGAHRQAPFWREPEIPTWDVWILSSGFDRLFKTYDLNKETCQNYLLCRGEKGPL